MENKTLKESAPANVDKETGEIKEDKQQAKITTKK